MSGRRKRTAGGAIIGVETEPEGGLPCGVEIEPEGGLPNGGGIEPEGETARGLGCKAIARTACGEETLRWIVEPLLAWYYENARDLPWRTLPGPHPDPYRVWISEIMLQQTRVEAGRAYFLRWMEELPDIESLANVSDERLMKLWEGLGYYSRARNLKKAAGIVMEQYSGRLPDTSTELQKLPGIGPYTAGAISSIAFEEPCPAVDGNVLRVTARLLANHDDIGSVTVKKRTEASLRQVMPKGASGDFNQALMELGALICIPNGAAKCEECPLADGCLAWEKGITEEVPVKAPKKPRRNEEKTVLVLRQDGKVLLHKRENKGLLAGLWELPWLPGRCSEQEAVRWLSERGVFCGRLRPLPESVHIFSHIEWHMCGFEGEPEAPAGARALAALETDLLSGSDKEFSRKASMGPQTAEDLPDLLSPASMAASATLNETPSVYSRDTRKKEPEYRWCTPDEVRDTFSLPSAFRAYKPYLT